MPHDQQDWPPPQFQDMASGLVRQRVVETNSDGEGTRESGQGLQGWHEAAEAEGKYINSEHT